MALKASVPALDTGSMDATQAIKKGDAVRSKKNGMITGRALHDEDEPSLRDWERGIIHIRSHDGSVYACAVDELERIG